MGPCSVRIEAGTKWNRLKRNETNRNETDLNETKQIETKQIQNETNSNKAKQMKYECNSINFQSKWLIYQRQT